VLSSARAPHPSSKTTSTLVPREKEPAPSRAPAPAPTVAPTHEDGPAHGMLSARDAVPPTPDSVLKGATAQSLGVGGDAVKHGGEFSM
jgi:hypothetical protein